MIIHGLKLANLQQGYAQQSLHIYKHVLCSGQIQGSAEYCDKIIGGYNTTVLMVADPGSFTGSAEAIYYIQNLEVLSGS